MAAVTQPIQTETSAPPVKMTFWEYLKAYDSVEGVHAEWTPEKVETYTMSNNRQHQRILSFLDRLFGFFLDKFGLGETVLAGMPIYSTEGQPARQPDLMVVLSAHRDRIKETYLDGIPDMAVEIVSPESDERDHGTKFVEYEATGIPEYWLIDPIRSIADVYVLGSDHRYRRTAPDAQGRLTSAVLPGFALDPALLWQENLPGAAAVPALVERMG